MISFTMEEKNNQQISFLDTLVSKKNGFVIIDLLHNQRTRTDIWTLTPIMSRNIK